MESIEELTAAPFDERVLKADGLVLVEFWAHWCGPCKQFAPTLEGIAADYLDRVSVVKINVDVHREVATTYGVSGLPTLKLFSQGQVVKTIVGVRTKEALLADLTEVAE